MASRQNPLDSVVVKLIMKPKENQIHIYCTDELHTKAKALAEASDERTMSYVIVKLIEKAYDNLVKHNTKR